jgi:hypothetical protein
MGDSRRDFAVGLLFKSASSTKKRLAGEDRGLPRWYVKAKTAPGSCVHGLISKNCHTQEEYNNLLVLELEHMQNIAQKLNWKTSWRKREF